MSQILLEAFNSIPYPTERTEKNGMMDISYTFEDETNHSFRFHFEKRVNYGRNVFVLTLGQKSPNIKMYKRVFGKFHNPLRVIATLIDIVKDNRQKRSDVKGLIIEVPEQAFGAHGRLVDKIIKRELRTELKVQDLELSIEEFEKMGLKGVVATVKPYQFDSVFNGKIMKDILDNRDKVQDVAIASSSPVEDNSEEDVVTINIEGVVPYIVIERDTRLMGKVARACEEVFSGYERLESNGIRSNGPKMIVDFKPYTTEADISPYLKSLIKNLQGKGIKTELKGNRIKNVLETNRFKYELVTDDRYDIDLRFENEADAKKAYDVLSSKAALRYGNTSLRHYGKRISTLRANATGREMDRKVERIIQILGNPSTIASNLDTNEGEDLENARIDVSVAEGEKSATAEISFQHNSTVDYPSIQSDIEEVVKKSFRNAKRVGGSVLDDMMTLIVDSGYLAINDDLQNIKKALEAKGAEVILHLPEVPDDIKAIGDALKAINNPGYKPQKVASKTNNVSETAFKAQASYDGSFKSGYAYEVKIDANGLKDEKDFVEVLGEYGFEFHEKTGTDFTFAFSADNDVQNALQNASNTLKFRKVGELNVLPIDFSCSYVAKTISSGYALCLSTEQEMRVANQIILASGIEDISTSVGFGQGEDKYRIVTTDASKSENILKKVYTLLGKPQEIKRDTLSGSTSESTTHKTKDGFDFEVSGRKLTFKADVNFNSIMDYVFGWFKSEFDTIDGKRQFVDKTNGDNLTQNLIGVLEKLSITEAISKKVAEQFDTIISKAHREYDLSTTMYERSIGAPEGQISDYREFKGEVVVNDNGTAFAVFTSNTGSFVKSAREQFGSVDFEVNGNLNVLKVPLDGNFSIKEFDAGLVGKFLKAHDDNYGVLSKRFNPVKVIKPGRVTFQPSKNYASLSLKQDVACYLVGLEKYQQYSKVSSVVGFEDINTIEEFYSLCEVLDNYDFEGNYLKAFRCSKYISDARANGGELKIDKNGKELKVTISDDMIIINVKGMKLPKIDTPFWNEGDESALLKTYYMGHKKFNDALAVLDNFLDKELQGSTTYVKDNTIADKTGVVKQDDDKTFHFEHQKGGFKIVTKSTVEQIKAFVDNTLDLSDNGDGSIFVKLSHFSQTVGSKKKVSAALVGNGFTEGEHVATPGSAASASKAKLDTIQKQSDLYPVRIEFSVNDALGRVFITKVDATSVMVSDRTGKNDPTAYSDLFTSDFKRKITAAFKAESDIDEVVTIINQSLRSGVGIGIKKPLYIYKKTASAVKNNAPVSINWSTAETALKGQYFGNAQYKIVEMDIDEIIKRQSDDFRVDANNPTNRIGKRVETALAHIQSGGTMDRPVVEIDAQGNLQVVDGRHRLAAMKELGIKKAEVFLFEAPKESEDIKILGSNKPSLAVKAPKIERVKITNDAYKITADGKVIASARKSKVKGLNSSGWSVSELNSGISLTGYVTFVTLFNEFKAKYVAWYMENATSISIPNIDLKQFKTVKADVKAKFDTRSVGLPSQDVDNSEKFTSGGLNFTVAGHGVMITSVDRKNSLDSIEMRLKSHGIKTQNTDVGRVVVQFKQGLNKYEFFINERTSNFKGLAGGVSHSASNFVFVPTSVANGSAAQTEYARSNLRKLYVERASLKSFEQFIAQMSGGRSVPFSSNDERQPMVTAVLDMTKEENVSLIQKALGNGMNESMNEGIKEDLTGVAPKVNKVDKSLLEKSMRQLGMYQSSFAYGGSTFTVSMNEGVVDILPTSGNVAYLSKLLGVKLGQDLVQDERGGLRFDIA